MEAAERTSRLVETLRREGRVDVVSAAAELGVVEMTVRRDLDQLADRGLARRVRGGAVSLMMRGEELPFAMREVDAVAAKRRIAARVAALIEDGEAVALDSGTTVLELARLLPHRRLTALPVSLHAATALAGSSSVRLLVPGGTCRPGELSLSGPFTLSCIASLRLDTAVIGCCGIAGDGRVTTHDVDEAAVKQALMTSARRRVLVADGSKFAQTALAVVGELTAFDVIVTDDSAPEQALSAAMAAGVDVLRV